MKIFQKRQMNKAVEMLLENIKNHPEQWVIDDYVAHNNLINIDLWIANGPGYCGIYRCDDKSMGKMNGLSWSHEERKMVFYALSKIPDLIVIKKLSS
jgi:hypothetical protein